MTGYCGRVTGRDENRELCGFTRPVGWTVERSLRNNPNDAEVAREEEVERGSRSAWMRVGPDWQAKDLGSEISHPLFGWFHLFIHLFLLI